MGSLAARASATDLGASLYRVFFFIKASPFAPESGAEDSNAISSDTKTDGQYLVVNLAKTKITFLFFGANDATGLILSDKTGGLKGRFTEPYSEFSFANFATSLSAHASAFAKMRQK